MSQYNENNQHPSIIRQNFNATNNSPSGSTVDIGTIIQTVTNDMNLIEKCGQWLLSSYAPYKDKPLFTGFEDYSFEEIRLGYYNAKANGTLETYTQKLMLLLQEAVMKVRSLQNQTPQAVEIIRGIYDQNGKQAPNKFSGSQSVFGTTQNSVFGNTNIFGQSSNAASSNIFTTTQAQSSTAQSIFAEANKALFNAPQQSIFGNTNQNTFANSQQTNSPLAQSGFQQNKTFGNEGFKSGGFVNTPFSSNLNQSPLGVNPPIPQTFVTQQLPPFINAPIHTSNSILATSPSNNTNIFNTPTSQNTFFNNTNNSFINQQTTQSQAPSNLLPTTNIFNSNIPTAVNSFNMFDESIYSKPEDLSERDIKSYQADVFEFGKVPEKPPHKSMC